MKLERTTEEGDETYTVEVVEAMWDKNHGVGGRADRDKRVVWFRVAVTGSGLFIWEGEEARLVVDGHGIAPLSAHQVSGEAGTTEWGFVGFEVNPDLTEAELLLPHVTDFFDVTLSDPIRIRIDNSTLAPLPSR